MKLHHLRNACFVLESGEHFILVDPMIGKIGTIPPFTLFRFKPKKNPIVPFPENGQAILEKVTHCLITHQHPDHIDKDAIAFLKEKQTPVTCSEKDGKAFRKKGLNIVQELKYWEKEEFLGGSIVGIPARHGYGFVAGIAGNVMGFYIELPNTPSVYVSADTIYTEDVNRALEELKPEVTVLACGKAQLDFGKPLLMDLEDIVKFVKKSPNKVFANHMEALNHCPVTREQLKELLIKNNLLEKVAIPSDGEVVEY